MPSAAVGLMDPTSTALTRLQQLQHLWLHSLSMNYPKQSSASTCSSDWPTQLDHHSHSKMCPHTAPKACLGMYQRDKRASKHWTRDAQQAKQELSKTQHRLQNQLEKPGGPNEASELLLLGCCCHKRKLWWNKLRCSIMMMQGKRALQTVSCTSSRKPSFGCKWLWKSN